MGYTIANPDEYLAVTGMGIETIKITKSAWVYPFQRVSIFPSDITTEGSLLETFKLNSRLYRSSIPSANFISVTDSVFNLTITQ